MHRPETLPGTVELSWPEPEGGLDAQRLLDLLLVVASLPLTLPIMLLAGLALRIDSPGPVLFRQARLGRGGRVFDMFKLRSMHLDADPDLHRRHVQRLIDPDRKGPAWQRMDADPRVTRVGRWLRASGLDELPQLFNVLAGQMSLVGPRPALPYEAELWQDWHHQRLAVRPGITGLWQVEGRDRVDFDGMVHLDLEYIRRRSLGLDLRLLARTPLALLDRSEPPAR